MRSVPYYSLEVATLPTSMYYMSNYHLFNEIFLEDTKLYYCYWYVVTSHGSVDRNPLNLRCPILTHACTTCEIPHQSTLHIDSKYLRLTWLDRGDVRYIENSEHNMELLKQWKKSQY